MADKKVNNGVHLSISTGAVALGLTLLGGILFYMSYSTGYYIFGQMKSGHITAFIVVSLLAEIIGLVLSHKAAQSLATKLIPFVITALLAASAMLIIGDRVEGIGNCIITDYDSGHGGEEAIFMSLIGAACLLVAMVYNIIGSFSRSGVASAGKIKTIVVGVSGGILAVAALVATVMLTGAGSAKGGASGGVAGGSGEAGGDLASGTYTISFNQANNNLGDDVMPDYQFLSANMGGLAKADARFYVDITLTLDGQGAYSLVSESYVFDSGKRVEVGDPSGLGLVYRTTSEGTYTGSGDTVTTSAASHVKFELATDTYSEQMKAMMHLDLDGSDADGEYDSADYPVLLTYVPETVWTLGDGEIISYGQSSLSGTFTISFNQANNNLGDDVMPDSQFLSANMAGLAKADARFYVDITLTLDGQGNYTLVSDSYVFDSGKRVETGDPSGLGLVYRTTSEGTYTDNGDGTVTTAPAAHVKFELATDTYSEQMKAMMHLDLNGSDADGEYDSADFPILLSYVPGATFTLDSSTGTIVSYIIDEAEGEAAEEAVEESDEAPAAAAESLVVTSEDGGTTMTFNPDGTCVFAFETYGISEECTWTYEGGKLTVINPNGDAAEAEGDPMTLHYVSAASPDLVGDYVIAAADLSFEAAGAAEEAAPAAEPVVITSEDGGTTMTFSPDGTCVFAFETYGISEECTWTYEGGKLTVINPNGDAAEAEGDPMTLHYVSAASPDLVGDYTIDAAIFG